ncbi:hypothetical protein [Aestuariivirga sp.]|uniref:hypothetical protein n=1 Tax=Aestuariivirga sp. TaxID=2650926 RepID=UPI0039E62453
MIEKRVADERREVLLGMSPWVVLLDCLSVEPRDYGESFVTQYIGTLVAIFEGALDRDTRVSIILAFTLLTGKWNEAASRTLAATTIDVLVRRANIYKVMGSLNASLEETHFSVHFVEDWETKVLVEALRFVKKNGVIFVRVDIRHIQELMISKLGAGHEIPNLDLEKVTPAVELSLERVVGLFVQETSELPAKFGEYLRKIGGASLTPPSPAS